MTELSAFLASVYDAFSEAEMQALKHGQVRLAELLESGAVPEDVSVPVYHASEVQVNLDVGLVAEETEDGMEVFVTDADDENASALNFGVELFELLEKEDLEDLDYDTVLPGHGGLPTKKPPENRDEKRRRREERRREKKEKERAEEKEREEEEAERAEEKEREEEEAERAEEKEREEEEAERAEEKEREEDEERGEDEPEEREEEENEEDENGITGRRVPPIDVIDDIEPRHRARLRDAGIERLPQLLERSPEEITETLADADADVSTELAAEWRSEARGLSSLLSERDADLPVELVDGIGPTFGSRLREAGAGDLSDLAAMSPEDIAAFASTSDATVSAERAASWRDRAESYLAAMESGGPPELDSDVDSIDAADTSEQPDDTGEPTDADE